MEDGVRSFPKEDKVKAMDALERVNILDKYDQRSDELSGGQQQRISIARALAQEPNYFSDEPVASLDPLTTKQVMDDLKKINEELGITILINLHFVDLALEYGTRIIGLRVVNLYSMALQVRQPKKCLMIFTVVNLKMMRS